MKKFSKRFIALFLAVITVLSLTVSASAAEMENTNNDPEEVVAQHITYEVTSEGIVSVETDDGVAPCSSISGYANGTFTTVDCLLSFPVVSSGEGGMGITVKTSSSWDGYMSMDIGPGGQEWYINDYAMPSNGERQFHDLYHETPMNIGMYLYGIPNGQSVYVEIWVYG